MNPHIPADIDRDEKVQILSRRRKFDIADGAPALGIALSGGAQAKNIFWQVAGQATLGTTLRSQGVMLCQTMIAMNTGSVLNGRAQLIRSWTLLLQPVMRGSNSATR